MFSNRARRISHVIANLPHGRRRIATVTRQRVDVRDHLFRSLINTPPTGIDVLEELQIFRRMHGCNRAKAMILRTDNLTACSLRTGEQALNTLRLFGVSCGAPLERKAFGS